MRSALLAACAVTMLTACAAQEQSPLRTSDAQKPSPSLPATPRCQADGFTWQSVVHRTALIGLSDAKEIQIPAHGSASPPKPKLIRTLSASISPTAVEAGVRSTDALASLEDKTSEMLEPINSRVALHDPAELTTSKMINDSDATVRGRFVEAVGLRLVTGTFTVTCTGGTVHGTVTTWGRGRSYESLRCGIKDHLSGIGREAERKACTDRRAVNQTAFAARRRAGAAAVFSSVDGSGRRRLYSDRP
ncbi:MULTISPECIES: hypothetical protein [unclassified Streptomyces]|uniref:hypothetical protein n=1 Tax=unclassified Streptomyces TaxID=2593676 RepID=UPI000B826AF6|nr:MULTISPECIES: hypothetical protein [unclassified Streptomyces]